jgi:site-specific DNA-cytosine methylase
MRHEYYRSLSTKITKNAIILQRIFTRRLDIGKGIDEPSDNINHKQNDMVSRKQLNTFHLFAGAGGGILADLLLGHNPIGACEIEPYPRNVLLARQRDGILPEFPIWDDVGTLDGTPWRGSVDILCGGFPCQDISSARTNNHVNGKQLGLDGAKSGLWRHMARVIMEMQPEFALIENSPNLRTKGHTQQNSGETHLL